MKIKVGNFRNEFETVEIPDNTFLITVDVITGDEVVKAFYRNESGQIRADVFDWGHRIAYMEPWDYYLDPTDERLMSAWQNRTTVNEPCAEDPEINAKTRSYYHQCG